MKKVSGFFAAAAFVVAIGGALTSNAFQASFRYGAFNTASACPTTTTTLCNPSIVKPVCTIGGIQVYTNDTANKCVQPLYFN
jgi:hypothetical protein